MVRVCSICRALLSCLLLLFAFAAVAQAATSYRNVGNFGAGTIPSFPTSVAVDAAGNVIVPNGERLQVFDPGPEAALIADTQYPGAAFYSLAVDPSSGGIYATDFVGSRILRLTSDGGSPPIYAIDNTYTSPPAGEGEGQISSFQSQLAIAPGNGDLLIADVGAQRVSRFEADGAFVSSFNGSDRAEGAFTSLRDVAVAPGGDVYSVESRLNFAGEVSGARVDRFNAAGEFQERIGAGQTNAAVSVAFDPTRDNLTVSSQGGGFSERPPELQVFHEGDLTDQFSYPAETENSAAPDLAFNPTTGRLYGLTGTAFVGEKASVQVFDPVVVAELKIDGPDQLTPTSAHFSGTVDPVGNPTGYRFEYSSDTGKTWQSTPEASAGEGEAPVPVEATVATLEPNTPYLVRLEAHNAEASAATAAQAFTTSVSLPATNTLGSVEVTTSKATLRGTVNPFGLSATYHFEYGPTTGYGSRIPVGHEALAGQGREPLPVEQMVEGLQPATTYHYRLVAESSAGTSFGADRTFSTDSVTAAGRVYELASQTDKGGSRIDHLWAHASADGESIVFQPKTAIPGPLSNSAPLFPRYQAKRGESAWSVVGLDPPLIQAPNPSNFFFDVLAISEDATKAVVISPKKLAPGAGEGDSNVYLRDIDSGSYTTIATASGPDFWNDARSDDGSASQTILGGTTDFSKVVFQSEGVAEFIPETDLKSVYEWSAAAGLRVVAENAITPGTNSSREPNIVSADGSTIFYIRQADPSDSFSQREIWAEVDGEDLHVSSPQPSANGEEFVGASADGRYAFTLADPGSIFRYDLESRQLAKIDEGLPAQSGGLQVSRDGSYVYYVGQDNTLRLWHDGEKRTVAEIGSTQLNTWLASPSGRYFVFTSTHDLTGFDAAGFQQVYLYDAESEELACASCRTDGKSPAGDAGIGLNGAEFEHWFPRSVNDGGEVFFDTPDPLVPADVNSSDDVYAFDESEVHLISAGTGAGPSNFADASADGRDVFFTTQDRLVAIDTDAAADMYDARIGGGLAGQNQAPPQPPCTGEGCRGLGAPAPAPPPIATEAQGGNAKKKPQRKRCRNGRKAKAKARCGKGKKKQSKPRSGRSGR